MRYAARLGRRTALFERPHHQSVAQVLSALDGPLLRENKCLFGGGTLIALRYGEYRESVAIDFMVSDRAGYRTLPQLLTGSGDDEPTPGPAARISREGGARLWGIHPAGSRKGD